MELDKYPEDQTEKDLEKHVAPAIRGHMIDFLRAIASRSSTRHFWRKHYYARATRCAIRSTARPSVT